MVIEDMGLAEKITPIDMIIGDKADVEKSHSAKMFELKAEIGKIIMPGGHNNCSTHSVADVKKSFVKPSIFRDDFLFGSMQNLIGCVDVKRSRLGIKHRWPPPLY